MPDIKFACPGCKVTLKVSDKLAGKKIKCPKCAAIAPIPGAAVAPAAAPPPLAKPVAAPPPIAHKPAPPPPPLEPLAPALEMSELEDESPPISNEIENDYEDRPAPRSRKPAPPKKKGALVSMIALVLALLYVVGIVVVYLGIMLPMPEALKAP